MNDDAHLIEIDSLVLTGVDQRDPSSLSAHIEAEVLQALGGTGLLATHQGLANNETRVAGEVARTVVRSIQGGSDGV